MCYRVAVHLVCQKLPLGIICRGRLAAREILPRATPPVIFFLSENLWTVFCYSRATAKRTRSFLVVFFSFFPCSRIGDVFRNAPLEGKSHGLSTLQPHRMYSYCLRLLSGDDIVLFSLSLCLCRKAQSGGGCGRHVAFLRRESYKESVRSYPCPARLAQRDITWHKSIVGPDFNVFGGHMLPCGRQLRSCLGCSRVSVWTVPWTRKLAAASS